MDEATRELAQTLLASLQQLALELERAQQQSFRARNAYGAPAVAQVLREWGTVPAAPSAHSLMAAQLQLVGKVFPQLQAQARQLVTAE
jgi:hypothetical protein